MKRFFLTTATIILLGISLSACVSSKHHFFPEGVVKVRDDGSFNIPNPADKIVILYTPGSNHNNRAQPCYKAASTPSVLLNLNGKKIAGKEIIIDGYCSKAVGNLGAGISMSEARAPELEGIISTYIKQGVPANQVFVAGQSMGGWAAVLVEARKKVEIGGIIAFAPANGISRDGRRYASHMAAIRRQEEAVSGLDDFDGLVFLFEGDPYNSPQDLIYMKDLPGISYLAVAPCSKKFPHMMHRESCFEQLHKKTIVKFIEKKLNKITL